MKELKNKKVVVTGASSGIGLALTKLLLDEGCTVVAAARSTPDLGVTHPLLHSLSCDISSKEGVDKLFEFAIEKMGTIDVFVANAGFAYYERLGAPQWDHIQNIFDTNVTSAFYSAQKMKQLHGESPFSFVANSSAMGLLSLPGYALYCGTKAAVRGFADAYRHELNDFQHFQVVYPIATRTGFFKAAGSPQPWPSQTPEMVAKAIIKGIRSRKNHIFPSKLFYATALVNRVIPVVFPLYVYNERNKFRHFFSSNKGGPK